ncbi:hypothetical protein [Agarilytica rhodophyticola]|uniref:hypothetical protein n=1 Tax=Agarilytica rhodophyticola TaxID=1737490 RepID=UPI000B34A189|nr:hypothetical protein [Agarilytica rhodophyticola]
MILNFLGVVFILSLLFSSSCSNRVSKVDETDENDTISELLISARENADNGKLKEALDDVKSLKEIQISSDYQNFLVLMTSGYVSYKTGHYRESAYEYLAASLVDSISIQDRLSAYEHQAHLFFKIESYVLSGAAVDKFFKHKESDLHLATIGLLSYFNLGLCSESKRYYDLLSGEKMNYIINISIESSF